MQNFDYVTPTRLIFGEGVISELPAVMKPVGKRVLLTYGGGSIKRMGLYDKVKELLADFEIYELSGIQPNPKYDPSVLDGVKICKEQKIDVILAVGGGSVLDCSKAIAAGAKYDGEPWDLIAELAAEPAFGLTEAEIRAEMKPEAYIGRCPEQVAAFTAKCRGLCADAAQGSADITL